MRTARYALSLSVMIASCVAACSHARVSQRGQGAPTELDPGDGLGPAASASASEADTNVELPPINFVKGSPWRPMDRPPAEGLIAQFFRLDDASIEIDLAGVLWWEGHDGSFRHSEWQLPRKLELVMRGQDKVWMIDSAHQLLTSDMALHSLHHEGDVPRMSTIVGDPVLRQFRDGFVLSSRGMRVEARYSRDLKHWTVLGRFQDRELVDARVSGDGHGIAIFSPHAIAVTDDGGASWQRLEGALSRVNSLVGENRSYVELCESTSPWVCRWRWSPEKGLVVESEARGPTKPASGDHAIERHPWRGMSYHYDPIQTDPLLPKERRPGDSFASRRVSATLWSLKQDSAVDADNLVAITSSDMGFAPALGTGRLGDELTWTWSESLRRACPSGARRLAACDGHVALACDGRLVQIDPAGHIEQTPIAGVAKWISYAGPSRLLIVAEAKTRSLAEIRAGKLTTLGAIPDEVGAPIVKSRCQSGEHAPIWLVDSRLAEQDSPTPDLLWQFSKGAFWRIDLEPIPPKQARPLVPLGFDPDGGLLLVDTLSLDRIHHVTPDGKASAPRLPVRLSESSKEMLSFNENGQGRVGSAWVTTDAGVSWKSDAKEPESPLFDPRPSRPTLVCGTNRCVLNDVFLRDDWVPRKVTFESIPTLADAKGWIVWPEWEREQKPKGLELPLACDVNESRVKHWDASRSVTLWPLVGSTVKDWVGLVARESRVGENPGASAARAHAPLAWLPVDLESGAPGPAKNQPLLGSAGAASQAQEVGKDILTLQSDEGVAFLDTVKKQVVWIHADGVAERRPLVPELLGGSDLYLDPRMSVTGQIARTEDGRWYVLAQTKSALWLAELNGANGSKQTWITLWLHGIESGAGLWIEGNDAYVASIESRADGTTAIVLRRIDGALLLGEATVVPGASGAPRRPLTLSSCGGSPPSGRMISLNRVDVGVLCSDAQLTRHIRVDRSHACVLSTGVDGLTSPPGTMADKARARWDISVVFHGSGDVSAPGLRKVLGSPVEPVDCWATSL